MLCTAIVPGGCPFIKAEEVVHLEAKLALLEPYVLGDVQVF